ncbi:hypothetical protein NG791_11740 [Laspinema sp. D1]|uniref:hypothetical protein n=1 Tax=Laspinema palackyanum TaxID=3231601 RepID=UPI00348BE2CD|nr:hypothetical protein [Laspinema sp. D2b]
MGAFKACFYTGLSGLLLLILVRNHFTKPAECNRSFCFGPGVSKATKILGLSQPQFLQHRPRGASGPHRERADRPMLVLDHRLSECPEGSIRLDPPELSDSVVNQLKKEITQGLRLNSLMELETKLGEPKCDYLLPDGGMRSRYLMDNGGSIKATEKDGRVEIEFSGLGFPLLSP